MGDLIVMTRPNHSIRRDLPPDAGAAILFFTGVRYERMTETDTALASVTPPRRATKPRRRPTKTTDAKRA